MNYLSVLLEVLKWNKGSTLSYLSGPQYYQLNLHTGLSKYTVGEIINYANTSTKHTVRFNLLAYESGKSITVNLVLPNDYNYEQDKGYVVDSATRIVVCKVCLVK